MNRDYKPLFYIVSAHHNTLEMTREFLNSLKKLSYQNFKVVLIDDGSTDGSGYVLKNEYPWVKLLFNTYSKKYVYSMNKGIKYALNNGADYIFVANNDTRNYSVDYIQVIIKKFMEDLKTGMVTSIVYKYNGEIEFDGKEQHIFGVVVNMHGTGYSVKREVFEKIGFFDQALVNGFENEDFFMRFINAGFKAVTIDNVSYQHKGQGTANNIVFYPTYFDMRNLIWFTKKYNKNAKLRKQIKLFIEMIIARSYYSKKFRKYVKYNDFKNIFLEIKAIVYGLFDGFFKEWKPYIKGYENITKNN